MVSWSDPQKDYIHLTSENPKKVTRQIRAWQQRRDFKVFSLKGPGILNKKADVQFKGTYYFKGTAWFKRTGMILKDSLLGKGFLGWGRQKRKEEESFKNQVVMEKRIKNGEILCPVVQKRTKKWKPHNLSSQTESHWSTGIFLNQKGTFWALQYYRN